MRQHLASRPGFGTPASATYAIVSYQLHILHGKPSIEQDNIFIRKKPTVKLLYLILILDNTDEIDEMVTLRLSSIPLLSQKVVSILSAFKLNQQRRNVQFSLTSHK